jgi:c-di-GMP-binding flagellar brake protein YcgR
MNCSGGDFDPASQGLAKADERRSHLRWDATASGVAVIFRGCAARAALIDLSPGGMAVQYTPAGPGLPAAPVCDLISVRADAGLPRGIQCRTVYDIAALAEGLRFSGETIRRRGFQFLGMAARQERQIRALLEASPVGIDGSPCPG